MGISMKVKVEIMEQFLMMPMTRIVTLQNDGIHEKASAFGSQKPFRLYMVFTLIMSF